MRYGMIGADERDSRCIECGDIIGYGRTDRKFCCEKCKNRYNNRKNKIIRNLKLRIRNALERNYRILENLVRSGVPSIGLDEISMMGYHVEYSTSYHKAGKKNIYWCYDIKYVLTTSKLTNIVKIPLNLRDNSLQHE